MSDRLRLAITGILIITLVSSTYFILYLSPAVSSDPTYGTTTYDFTYKFTFTNLGTNITNVRMRLAIPRTLEGIQTLRNASILTPGYQTFTDQDDNNYVTYNYPQLTTGQNFTITIRAVVEVYLLDFKVNPARIGAYNTTGNPFLRYTQPGIKIESNDQTINYTGHILTQSSQDNFSKARRLYDFVLQWINYQRMNPEEGALFAYQNRFGDCDEYTDLFNALARSIGVPTARVTSLFDYTHTNFQAGHTFTDTSLAHAYPIFYLQNYGWIPSDPTNGRNRTGTLPTAPESHWAKADGSIITMTIGQSNNPYWLVNYTPTAGEQPITQPTYEITMNSRNTQYTSLIRNITVASIVALPILLGITAISKSIKDLRKRRARMEEVRRLHDKNNM